MAHNLNINNGKVSFASVKEKAWHGLGKVLDNVMDAETAIREAGLDFEVIKVPNEAKFPYKIKDSDLTYYENLPTNSYSVVRTDNKVVLGDKFGSKYEVVQNREAFGFFDSFVDKGEAIYETAGCLGKGEIVFICAKIPQSYIRVGQSDDIIDKYLLFTLSHDGSSSIMAMFTPIRVVCNNTLQAALKSTATRVTVRHTKSVHDRLAETHKVLGLAKKASIEAEQLYTKMSKVRITDDAVKDLIYKVVNSKTDISWSSLSPKEKEELEVSAKTMNVMKGMFNYYHKGVGQDLVTCKGTVWGAYNAITGYYQNAKDYKDASTKMDSLIFGDVQKKAQQALVLSWELAK